MAENFVEMEQFAKAKKEWLQGFLELPQGIPLMIPFRESFDTVHAVKTVPTYIQKTVYAD